MLFGSKVVPPQGAQGTASMRETSSWRSQEKIHPWGGHQARVRPWDGEGWGQLCGVSVCVEASIQKHMVL